ncbi:MAG TPA: chitobiase/beta-hexosaminidase C-terminal domain-containing protein, partial [Planctomycetota bacterium]|nr:chitobiase/beta-hexosaminidase C-terminal domain-containing protein [Planctomycetota bacterium]
ASLRLRVPFEAADPSSFDSLVLRIRYDDGFVAWLNGREVARRNAPAALAWNSAALEERPRGESGFPELIDISTHLDVLRPGRNVLVLQGLNVSPSDTDFLLLPELEATSIEDGDLRFFREPTPRAFNTRPGFLGFVADTKFSRDRGFFEAPFDVRIETGTAGAEIRYTTDGTRPTEDSGQVYTGPIRVATTTLLRAAAFLEGYGPTNVDTQSYIFPLDVVKQRGTGFPPSWGGTPADYAMDPTVAEDPRYRDTIAHDITTRIRTMSIVMDTADLFGPRGIYSNTEGRGDAWERPASMELIDPEGGEDLQVDCGIRIFGYGWRSHSASMKHAFRLIFRREYGPPKLEHRFFPDFDVDRLDAIVLRSQGSRSWNDFRPSIEQTCYIRDAWARYTEAAMGKLTTSSTYVHLYLNGLYWGLYNPVERPDAEFMAEHLGGSEEEYDSLNARVGTIEVIDGTREAWDALIRLARSNRVGTLEGYREIQESLDVEDLADYMLVNFYTVNQDWVGSNGNNMRVAGGPGALGGFKAFCWDMEYSIWNARDNVMGVLTQYDTPALLYARLRTNDEFRILFADRAHRHLFHGGALTPEAAAARWMARAEEIDRAVVGESARWGDRRRRPPYTRDVEWVRERERLMTSFFPQRTGIFLEQLRTQGMYPKVVAPEFSRQGGPAAPGFTLEMTAPAGAILYTLDGSDPRVEGGAAAPGALTYAGPIPVAGNVLVKARALDQGSWSALNEAAFFDAMPPPLRITEIMYHPAGAEDLEFLELKNVGNEPLDLAGVSIAEAVEFDFATGRIARLLPDALVLVVEDLDAFLAMHPGLAPLVAGAYAGQLDNAGERVRIEGPFARTILDFAYDDAWYPATDGGGESLVAVDPRADAAFFGVRASWRAGGVVGGTPGLDDSEEPPGGLQLPSDLNQDGRTDLTDAIALLGHLFLGAETLLPCDGGTLEDEGNRALLDSNGDERVDLADVVHFLGYLFQGGPAPALGSECVRIPSCPPLCGG